MSSGNPASKCTTNRADAEWRKKARTSWRRLLLGSTIVAAALSWSPGFAQEASIRVAQESSPGAGDFDDNVLGYVTPFERSGETAAEVYGYDGPTFSGSPPAAASNASLLYVVNTASGPALFAVHDARSDEFGGNAFMSFVGSGREEGGLNVLVFDDPDQEPSDTYVRNSIGRVTTQHGWRSCCTDGVVLQASPYFGNGDAIRVSVTAFKNLEAWTVIDADGADIELDLDLNRRVELRDFGLERTVKTVLDSQREGEKCLVDALEEAGAPSKVKDEIEKQNEKNENERKTYQEGVKSYENYVKSSSGLTEDKKLEEAFKKTKDIRKEVLDPQPGKATLDHIKSLTKASLDAKADVQTALVKIVEPNLDLVRNNANIVNNESGQIAKLAKLAEQQKGLSKGTQKQLAKNEQLRKKAADALKNAASQLDQILDDLDMLGSSGVGKDACEPEAAVEPVPIETIVKLNEQLAGANKSLMQVNQDNKSLAAQIKKSL